MAIDLSKLITEYTQTLKAKSIGKKSPIGGRFKFDIPASQMRDILETNYRIFVEGRRMTYAGDIPTMNHLSMAAKWMTDDSMKPSLLMTGNPGNGKTCLAKAIVESYEFFKKSIRDYSALSRQQYRLSIEPLKTERYREYVDLLGRKSDGEKEADSAISRIPENILSTRAQDLSDLANDRAGLDRIKACPFVILDDLGCEPASVKVYGTSMTPAIDIICYRYDNMLPTVITTNLRKAMIGETYGLRILDRLEEMCDIIPFLNQSYRHGQEV